MAKPFRAFGRALLFSVYPRSWSRLTLRIGIFKVDAALSLSLLSSSIALLSLYPYGSRVACTPALPANGQRRKRASASAAAGVK